MICLGSLSLHSAESQLNQHMLTCSPELWVPALPLLIITSIVKEGYIEHIELIELQSEFCFEGLSSKTLGRIV